MLATSLLFRDCCSFSGTGSLACRLAPKTATPCACPGCASHFPASKLRMHISRIAIIYGASAVDIPRSMALMGLGDFHIAAAAAAAAVISFLLFSVASL